MNKIKKALVIGVDWLNPQIYGSEGRLPGTLNDAANMSEILTAAGYDVTILTGEEATVEALDAYLLNLRNHRRGKVIIYYSGHGTQRYNPEEKDRFDELWCLHDGMYADNRLHDGLVALSRKLNVILFSDSCHSDNMLRSGPSGPEHPTLRVKAFNTRNVDDKFAFWGALRRRCGHRVLLFSGCKEYETSAEIEINGVAQGNFTRHLVRALKNAPRTGYTYNRLYRDIIRNINYQSPQLSWLGTGYRLKNYIAFK